MNRRTILSFALLAGLAPAAALAQTKPVRIGVMNDMSSVYSDFQGPGSVLAAQMAVEDFSKTSSRKVEVIFADHQNKADVGSVIAGRWYDVEGVDMIVDLPNSPVALAVADVSREKNKVVIGSGAGTALLTGAKCSPAASSTRAARPGSSSPRIMRSATISRSRPPTRCWRAAGAYSARSGIRSARATTRLSSCRRRPRGPRWSRSPTPAATP